jgi:SnoaL-like domain
VDIVTTLIHTSVWASVAEAETAAARSPMAVIDADELLTWDIERSIASALVLHARAVDQRDLAVARSFFSDDARIESGPFVGDVEEWVKSASAEPASPYRSSVHRIANIDFDHRADGRVAVESYFQASFICSGAREGQIDVVGGRYLDIFAEREGSWLCLDRLGLVEWETCTTASAVEHWKGRAEEGITCDNTIPELLPAGQPMATRVQESR